MCDCSWLPKVAIGMGARLTMQYISIILPYTMTKIMMLNIRMVMPMKKLCRKSPNRGPTSICIRLDCSMDKPMSLTRVFPAMMPLESDTTFCVRSKIAITMSKVLLMSHTETAVLKIQRMMRAGSNCAMLLCWVIISMSS